jgi:hypothetical protein
VGRTTLRVTKAAAATAGAAATVAVLAFPSASSAVTIGSDLKPAPTGAYGCGIGGTCMIMQTAIPGNPYPMKAPFDGVITKWRMRKGPGGDGERGPVRLRVVRKTHAPLSSLRRGAPPGTGHWLVVRQSAKEKLDSLAGVSVFHTHLKVHKGDRIAMKLKGTLDEISFIDPLATFKAWFPAPAVGSTTKPMFDDNNAEFLWNAKVEHH